MAPENPVPQEYAMQWQKVKGMVVVFWFVKCNKGNVFVFSKLIITKNKKAIK
jgi:hypothetical protein